MGAFRSGHAAGEVPQRPLLGRSTWSDSSSPNEPGGADDAEEGPGEARRPPSPGSTSDTIGQQLPYDLLPWYLALQEQTPAQSGELPAVVPAPTLDEGPHLSYALQWFAFASIAAIGYLILARRQVLDRDATVDAD